MGELHEQLRARLQAGFQAQPDLPEETVDNTLRALCHAAAGEPRSALAGASLPWPALDDAGMRRLGELVESRLRGTPLAYLTGRQSFMGLEMITGPEALVPRRETELLGRTAISLARELALARKPVRVIDVCTGSGNLALAIASGVPDSQVFAADISESAVALARRNADNLGLSKRVVCSQGDMLAPFETPEFLGATDLLTCNPPYISTARVDKMSDDSAEREPRLAFDGGPFGVRILMRLLQDAPRFVRPGGWLAFEVGLGQGASIMKRMRDSGTFGAIVPHEDEKGALRVLSASL